MNSDVPLRRDHLLSGKEFSVERGELEHHTDRRAEFRQGLQVQRVDLSATILIRTLLRLRF